MISMYDLPRLHAPLRDELQDAIDNVMSRGEFILGPHVHEIERVACEYLGVRFAVGVSSGTAALELALKVVDVRGKVVLTTAFSFAATATAILEAGGRPVFVDIDPETFQMDLRHARELASKYRPKVVLPVHLYGRTLDVEPLRRWVVRHRAYLIEDAAQAFGAHGPGRLAGTCGHLGCFSFYPTKNLGCFGDGGLVVTDHPDLAERVRQLREPLVAGRAYPGATNARLDALQAAVLLVKLPRLDAWNQRRRQIAQTYNVAFQGLHEVACPAIPEGHIMHQYTLRVPRRDALQTHLARCGIETRVYYPRTLPEYGCWQRHGEAWPAAVSASLSALSLPVHPSLTDKEQLSIISAMYDFFGRPQAHESLAIVSHVSSSRP
jgi:dTDP-4-amino-4,6-dideoxygalactose transaminase